MMNIWNKNVNCNDKTSITVNGKDIMESDNLELLDVTLDCSLNSNLHISNESQPENRCDNEAEESNAN